MDTAQLIQHSAYEWEIAPFGKMRAPAIIYASAVADAADQAKLAHTVARLEPLLCVKG